MRVQDVMTDQVYGVLPDTSADDAWNIMRMRRIHHLVVTQAGDIVGLLSARDFSGITGARARRLHTVADLMTPHVVTVSPATPIRRAAHLMRGHSIGCLVVAAGRRVVGIVTVADLLERMDDGPDRPADTHGHGTTRQRAPHKDQQGASAA